MKANLNFIRVNALSVLITVFVLAFGFTACDDDDETVNDGTIKYSGAFVKSADTITTTATGTATATYDPATMTLNYKLTWSGLSSNATGMHFHDAGPVIIPITGFSQATSGTYSGTATLTTEQAADLAAGKIYAQIHTPNFPGGEVKATLTKTSTASTSGGGGGY